MSCPENSEKLNAMLDGELPPAEAAALARHIAGCPACARHLAELAELRAALAEDIQEEAIPPEFLARISALLEAGEQPGRNNIVVFARRRAALPWIGTLTAIAALLAVMFYPRPDNIKDLMSVRDAALRTGISTQPEGNIAAPAVAGFRLTAVRADIVAGHQAKVLQYAAAGQTVTLCLWANHGEPAHGLRQAVYKGMEIDYWNDGTEEYWAASTAPAATLTRFVSELSSS